MRIFHNANTNARTTQSLDLHPLQTYADVERGGWKYIAEIYEKCFFWCGTITPEHMKQSQMRGNENLSTAGFLKKSCNGECMWSDM